MVRLRPVVCMGYKEHQHVTGYIEVLFYKSDKLCSSMSGRVLSHGHFVFG